MGFGDALVLLGIRYDSDEAVDFAKRLSRFIQDKAHQASRELAQQRGSFPNWPASVWDTEHHIPMRNATCTTVAPTGSISLIAECSSGIEPIFKPACKRRALDGAEFIQLHPLLERLGAEQGWLDERIKAELMSGTDMRKIQGIPRDLAETFVTAHDIAPEWHVHIQAAFQSNVDNAVSKTVNLPADATVDGVDRILKLTYESRCKGGTVYRDNSRENQVLSAVGTPDRPASITPRPRRRVTFGQTSKFRMGCGTLFVTVNRDADGICEVFANLGKAGGCPSQTEATCRAVSAALRSGVDPGVMIDQLHSIKCMSAAVARKANKGVDVLSCPDAIARALQEAQTSDAANLSPPFQRKCEECGHPVRWEARCAVCDFCGHNNCG
jgi:ribonucleoside-diphosphate reductase alpha chain